MAGRLCYRLNPLHLGPADVLRWGSDYRGPCGSHTRVVLALLECRGVDCRPLLLLDECGRSIHTVVEARIADRWVVGDPTYGIIYHRRDGSLASRDDLAADTSLFRAHVRDVPGYDPRFDYDSVSLINWRKIPVLLPAMRAALVRMLGEEQVNAIQRPRIWMRPWLFYGLVSLFSAVASVLVAWAAERRERRTISVAHEDTRPRHLNPARSER